mmetsp:Transcript_97163/g.279177  ORF Transcript_97163/g.279177 Transcript_97163/m.279177 type:complete len:268 (-) Transcript_97163:794-1597(-)
MCCPIAEGVLGGLGQSRERPICHEQLDNIRVRRCQAASGDAPNGPTVHPDVLEAAPPQEVHNGIPVCGQGEGRWAALRSSEATVVKQEDIATLAQIEVQPMGFVGHGLVVGGVGVAPHDHRPSSPILATRGRILQRNVLLRRAVRGLRRLSPARGLPRAAGQEHRVDFPATRRPDPVVVPGIADQQLGAELVERADRRHLNKSSCVRPTALLLLLQVLEYMQHLLHPLQANISVSLGLAGQWCAGDRVAHGDRRESLRHPGEPIGQR